MGAQQTDSSVVRDADRITTAYNTGVSVNCVFDTMSRQQQMAVYRELNSRHESSPNDTSVPAFGISFNSDGADLIRKDGKPDNGTSCKPEAKEVKPVLPRVTFSEVRPSDTSDRYAHPEKEAAKIENTALLALRGDEQAKLELRVQMTDLMGRPQEYRDSVIARMKEDGSFTNIGSDSPHVVVTTDKDGNPVIEFSKRLGLDKMTIPLNQTIEQQVSAAQENYLKGLGLAVGGLGKFTPTATMEAVEIFNGKEPKNLTWFMLYNKQHGKPAIDPAAFSH
ncbi:MAG: hypothetical protein C0507_14550 [Cyanobacteria bacterium PR.3.49]|nr:hypothetical protein [Cyanobacteria bacterium PR.3.49]